MRREVCNRRPKLKFLIFQISSFKKFNLPPYSHITPFYPWNTSPVHYQTSNVCNIIEYYYYWFTNPSRYECCFGDDYIKSTGESLFSWLCEKRCMSSIPVTVNLKYFSTFYFKYWFEALNIMGFISDKVWTHFVPVVFSITKRGHRIGSQLSNNITVTTKVH